MPGVITLDISNQFGPQKVKRMFDLSMQLIVGNSYAIMFTLSSESVL